jgi:hypothetical protein
VTNLIDAQRPWEEIHNALAGLSKSVEALVVKHEEYALQLNDEEFDDAEIWMNNCTREFNQCNMIANDYIRDAKRKDDENLDQNVDNANADNANVNDVNENNADDANVNDVNENDALDANVNDVDAIVNDVHNANVDDGNANVNDANVNANVNDANVNDANVNDANVNDANVNDANASLGSQDVNVRNKDENVTGSQSDKSATSKEDQPFVPVSLRHEKPKLPVFNGDVRKYFIFKDDFKHAIESRCSERDSITVLRTCLGPITN